MSSITVLDADGKRQQVNSLPKLGPAGQNDALPVVLAVDQSPLPTSLPQLAGATILSCATAVNGANWTAFEPHACRQMSVVNNSGADLEFRRGGAGLALPILNRMAYLILGITDANQISIRRIDQSDEQAVLAAEALA